MTIVTSTSYEKAFLIAANELADFYGKITGKKATLGESIPPSGDTIYLCPAGSEGADPRVKIGSDEFSLCSEEKESRTVLTITAGRARAILYGVYAFLEEGAGCHYFWDGDMIPKADSIPLEGFDLYEAPRFEYRAIRYFAHRGLHRFQAEHWSMEDWKREIDWMIKKRLNLFMLRIGMDDLFQRAFPDIVPYPSNEEPLPESLRGYDNRTTFWSLEYRGKLRKQILDYAFDRDLLHPEDCGTMTHWYSRTPHAFLEQVKPTLLQQESSGYSEKTGLAWNIYDDKNVKNYQHLTCTHAKEFGRPEIFHTIGLAERSLQKDREKGLETKKYAYDIVTEFVKENYPKAPILIAGWDFYFTYHADEVRKMIRSFDPETHILLDYSVDLKKTENDFEQWDVVGKFPWIFGIFHGYQPQSHIHGDYAYLDQKLKIAARDPFCKGMAFWPELSHSDTFMLEYFADNSWRPEFLPLEEKLERFCQKRYGENSEKMLRIWKSFVPLYSLTEDQGYYMSSFFHPFSNQRIIQKILNKEHPAHEKSVQSARKRVEEGTRLFKAMEETVAHLASLPSRLFENEFIARDAADLLRSITERRLDVEMLKSALAWLDGKPEKEIAKLEEICVGWLEIFIQILSTREEFSSYHTLENLKKVSEVNPYFENTLKDNLINGYCRSSVYEAARFIYLPEMKLYFKALSSRPFPNVTEEKKKIFEEFLETKLSEAKPEKLSLPDVAAAFLALCTKA